MSSTQDDENCQLYQFTLETIERQRETVIVESPARSEAIEFVKYELLPRSYVRRVSRITEPKDTFEDENSTVYHINDTSNTTQAKPHSLPV